MALRSLIAVAGVWQYWALLVDWRGGGAVRCHLAWRPSEPSGQVFTGRSGDHNRASARAWMVYTVTRVIIAGGGIVGLTAGRALLRAGMEVLVAEKADAIRAAGATLGLWANAVRVFDDLDVDVRSVGREAQMYFHGTSGQLLKTPEFGEEDHRYLLAHRASLNNLLAESVAYDNIRLEAAVAGFEEDQDRVTVRFADGSAEDADLLIGADGLYSKVRAQLFPGTDAQEHAGHRAWRAIVKAEHIGVPDDRLIVGGRHRTRGGYVRAPDGTVFWLLSQFGAPAPAASVKQECLTRSAWLTDGTWDCKLTELIDATPEQDILRNQIWSSRSSTGGCRRGSRSSATPRTPCRHTSRRAPPSVSRTWGCCATSSARTPASRPR
jgi:2-polyprenyl-6-methoxyphenol hydroxylase-like FAD-dependent oxidoreductase